MRSHEPVPALRRALLAAMACAAVPSSLGLTRVDVPPHPEQTMPYRVVDVTTQIDRAREVQISPDGRYLFVLGEPDAQGNDGLSIVDLETLQEVFFWKGGAKRVGVSSQGWLMLRSPDDIWFAPLDDNLGNVEGTGFLFSEAEASDLGVSGHVGGWSDVAASEQGIALAGGDREHAKIVIPHEETPDATVISLPAPPRLLDVSWATGLAVAALDDGAIGVWGIADGRHVADLTGLKGPIEDVAFSPDGTRVAAAGKDVVVWDAETGAEVSRWAPDEGRPALAWAAAWLVLGSGSGRLTFFDPSEGRNVADIHLQVPIRSVAVDGEGMVLAAAGTDGELVVLEHEARAEERMHTGEDRGDIDGGVATGAGAVTPVAASLPPAGAPVALDRFAPRGALTFESVGPVAVSPTEPIAVVGVGSEIAVLDLETGAEAGRIAPDGAEGVGALAFAPDGGRIAAAVAPGVVLLLGVPGGEVLQRLDVVQGDSRAGVFDVAVSPSGQVLAATVQNEVQFFDLRTGERVTSLAASEPAYTILRVQWNRGGTALASAGVDRKVRVWPTADLPGLSTESASCEIPASNIPAAMAFSSSGDALTLIDVGGVATSWDTASCQGTGGFSLEVGSLWKVAVGPDGTQLIVGGDDGTIRLVSASDGAVAGKLEASPKSSAVYLSPDGRWLLVSAPAPQPTELRIWGAR